MITLMECFVSWSGRYRYWLSNGLENPWWFCCHWNIFSTLNFTPLHRLQWGALPWRSQDFQGELILATQSTPFLLATCLVLCFNPPLSHQATLTFNPLQLIDNQNLKKPKICPQSSEDVLRLGHSQHEKADGYRFSIFIESFKAE